MESLERFKDAGNDQAAKLHRENLSLQQRMVAVVEELSKAEAAARADQDMDIPWEPIVHEGRGADVPTEPPVRGRAAETGGQPGTRMRSST